MWKICKANCLILHDNVYISAVMKATAATATTKKFLRNQTFSQYQMFYSIMHKQLFHLFSRHKLYFRKNYSSKHYRTKESTNIHVERTVQSERHKPEAK